MQSETPVTRLGPGLRRITAGNPSPMTFTGTQTYLVGDGEVAVIDPGPALPAHLEAVLGALRPDERITRILVTHSHLDHSPLARHLSEATGAPVMAAGPSDWGRRPVMAELAAGGLMGGGEGVDTAFAPDERIAEGDGVHGSWGRIAVLETPGHMANHLCFAWEGALFSGDLVMGWSTSLVSPPDGDMTAFYASVERLDSRADRIFYPGHGDPVTDPRARTGELLTHRRHREAQILKALGRTGPADADALATHIYTDIPRALMPAAARNVLAHLIDLAERDKVAPVGPMAADAIFERR